MRILLVEDNKVLADWLSRTLRKQLYAVDCVEDGEAADFMLRTEQYDLVLLDLALPKLGGHEVLRRLRERGNATPVLVLTADNSTRTRVLLRRSAHVSNPQIACGDLVYLGGSREFTLGGKPLVLTPRERTVLEVLIMKVGATVSKAMLGQSLPSMDDGVSADAIEIYVHRLRKKLEGSDATIVTLRGLGYLLRPVHHGA